MQEISFQLFDKYSQLPIKNLTDSLVRKLAMNYDKSCSDVFIKLKESVEKEGVKYMIEENDNKIYAVLKNSFSSTFPDYYESYEEALSKLT